MYEKYLVEYERFKQDIEQGVYDKSLVAVSVQIGRLSAFLELSDITAVERDSEENRLRELCDYWEKKILFKGGKNK